MLNVNPTTLARAVKTLKRGLNPEWAAAIEQAAQQLVKCKAISALNDSKLHFHSGKGKAFTATCNICENPDCRIGPCMHRVMALVFARYREEERRQWPVSEIVYGSQLQLNKDCSVTMTVEGRTLTLTAREFATACVFGEFGDVAESIGATELLLEAEFGFHEHDE
jgi:hypothetical protein